MSLPTHLRLGATVAAMGVFATTTALAVVPTDWTGATIGVQYLYPDTGSVIEDDATVTVISGAEGDILGVLSYDLSGSQIILRSLVTELSFNGATFNGLYFFDAGSDDLDLFGVTINPATTIAGLTADRVTWDANNIYVNFESLFLANQETQVVLDLQFVGSEVPEASTWAASGVLAAAVGGLWLCRRRA